MDKETKNMINRINSRLKRWEKRYGQESTLYQEVQEKIILYFTEGQYHTEERGKATYRTGDGTYYLSQSKDVTLTNLQVRQLEKLDKLTEKNMFTNQLNLAKIANPKSTYHEKIDWLNQREYVNYFLHNNVEALYNENNEWLGSDELYEFLKKTREEKAEIGYEEVYKMLTKKG